MGAILCPHCGVKTSLEPVLIVSDKALFPDKSTNNHSFFGKAVIAAIKDADYPHTTSYGIFECKSCNQRFVGKKVKYEDPEWLAVYPVSNKQVAEEIPEPINREFKEARLCLAVGAYIGCLMVSRTVLISLQREKKVGSLKELADKGIISNFLFQQADEVRLWANMVGHDNIPDVLERGDCEQLLVYMEALLNAVYVEPKRFSKLTQKRKEAKEA
ncbi:MAG: hypothetical protein Q8P44_10095 [Dehalococcoidia bacterium]|nr:hypothetical protein [Dehalococcoidia bacterium]